MGIIRNPECIPIRVIVLRKHMILHTMHHGLTYLLIIAYPDLGVLPVIS